jgi:hypothetical protein
LVLSKYWNNMEGNKNSIIVIAIIIELNLQVQFKNYNIRIELN